MRQRSTAVSAATTVSYTHLDVYKRQVKTSGVTGVEMEALTGVSTALLTIYDMCKAVDKGMELGEIHLVEKTGGKSGHYIRAEGGYV